MKYSLLFIFFLFTFSFGLGQSGGRTAGISSPSLNQNTGLISSNNRYATIENKGLIPYEEVMQEYEEIKGSPYLHEGEIVVDLILYTDSIISNVPIRYDLYNSEIIAKEADGSTIILDQIYYKGFIYNNDGEKETYLRLLPNDKTFYQVLFKTANFAFCKINKPKIVKDDRRVPGANLPTQEFIQKSEYFVIQNEVLLPVKLRNGEAMAYFPRAYRNQVPGLKREFNIRKLRKEEDYVEIINAFVDPD